LAEEDVGAPALNSINFSLRMVLCYLSNHSMQPEDNPYAALLSIDYSAIRAREYNYLIQLRDSPDWMDETGYLLNIHYTAALAEYMLEKEQKKTHEKSSKALSQAIKQFPWLIAPLFYELKCTFPSDFPPTVPPSPLQALYTDLYIHRSIDLWTPPEMSSWLLNTAKQTAIQVSQPPASLTTSKVPLNVARQLFVMGVPSLMSHIPREYTVVTQLATDPLPPPDSISPYDHNNMRGLQNVARDPNMLDNWVAQLVMGRRQPREPQVPNAEEREGEESGEEDEEHNEEADQNLIAQLTSALRNVVGWFGTSREAQVEEEGEEDGHGVD
jgi:hypothetical protein